MLWVLRKLEDDARCCVREQFFLFVENVATSVRWWLCRREGDFASRRSSVPPRAPVMMLKRTAGKNPQELVDCLLAWKR